MIVAMKILFQWYIILICVMSEWYNIISYASEVIQYSLDL